MTEADRIIADLKRLEPKLRGKGVTHLAIFGSRARGDNQPSSDLDVLIDVPEGIRFSLLSLVGVGHIIQDELGIETSVTMYGGLKKRFLDEIEPDVRPVF